MATKQINEFTAVGSSALTDQLLTETAANATKKCTLSQVFALLDDQALTWTAAQAFGAAVTMATTLGVTGAATFASTVGVTGTLTAGNLATGGTLAVTGTSSHTGAATFGSTLGVTGATTLSSTLAAGASTLASLAVTAGATIGTTLGVTGAATLSSTLAVTGISTLTGGLVAATAPTVLTTYGVGSQKEFTDTTGTRNTGVLEVLANPASSSAANYNGLVVFAATKTGNAQNLTALYSVGGGITAISAYAFHYGTGTVSNMAGVLVRNPAAPNGGTVTNLVGVYILPQSIGTNNWGIYQAGTTEKNYYGSNVFSLGGGHQFGATAQAYVANTLIGARGGSTALSGLESVIVAQHIPAPASASTGLFIGVAGNVTNSNANTAGATLAAGYFDARTSTAAGVLYGSNNRAIVTGAVAVPTVIGSYAQTQWTAAATTTTAYGYWANFSNTGAATVGTYYGLRVDAAAAAATTTWGVYVDAAKSNFGGGAIFGAPVQLPSYTLAGLAAIGASTWPRGKAWCSDHTGGAREVISDGTNWIDTRTGSIAA